MSLPIVSLWMVLFMLLAGAFPSPSTADDHSNPSGFDTYMHSGCFVCHGQLGYGGAGPRFRGDKIIAADDYVIGRIMLGGGIMPAFGETLSDKEIAAVATYIRTSWGNNFGPVDPRQVAATRKALDGAKVQAVSGEHGGTQ